MKLLHGLLISFLLAGCASLPHWEKAGASETASAEDLQKCRIEARLSPQSHPAAPRPQTSSSPLVDQGQERDAQEEQLIRQCMQDRGYSLKR